MLARIQSLIAAVLLLGCGGGGTFTPASQPADICALLTQADAQTILPTAAPGARQINAETNDFWSIECAWSDSSSPSGKVVTLILYGALTSTGARGNEDALTVAYPGSAPATAVSGLGDKAAYINNAGTDQRLAALAGSYLVVVWVYSITPDATEPQLHPLVAKAIAGL